MKLQNFCATGRKNLLLELRGARLLEYNLCFPLFHLGDGDGKAAGVSHQERSTF